MGSGKVDFTVNFWQRLPNYMKILGPTRLTLCQAASNNCHQGRATVWRLLQVWFDGSRIEGKSNLVTPKTVTACSGWLEWQSGRFNPARMPHLSPGR